MSQVAIATFTQNGHGVRLSEVSILSPSGCFVEERRYVVFSKTPGKPIDSALYTGPDAEDKARAQFADEKTRIELGALSDTELAMMAATAPLCIGGYDALVTGRDWDGYIRARLTARIMGNHPDDIAASLTRWRERNH